MSVLVLALALLAVPVCLACGYLLVLTLASRETPPPPELPLRLRFEVIVPAHNEAAGIGKTVESLLALDYPRELFHVVVIADNCGDDTAARAKAAGAVVRERFDAQKRGKGYALEFAFEQAMAEGWADAVVVVDADTQASANLLRSFAAHIEAGAQAVQADYAVQNPNDSWRTRLMTIALGMFHILRSRGREALGLSCGLRGNGMCFSTKLLQQVPHRAFSLVEDLEYGIRLGTAGFRVHYAGEAHVYGEMVSGEKASRSQRRRWEGGRWQMARQQGPALLLRALTDRDLLLFDLALDVLVPPLSTIVLAAGAGLGAALALAALGWPSPLLLALWGSCAGAIGLYVFRGWMLSATGARGLLDLLCAPFYIAWKLALALGRTQKKGEWVRTAREGETP